MTVGIQLYLLIGTGCFNAIDDDDTCESWAADGACTDNARWMALSCRKDCFQCATATPPEGRHFLLWMGISSGSMY